MYEDCRRLLNGALFLLVLFSLPLFVHTWQLADYLLRTYVFVDRLDAGATELRSMVEDDWLPFLIAAVSALISYCLLLITGPTAVFVLLRSAQWRKSPRWIRITRYWQVPGATLLFVAIAAGLALWGVYGNIYWPLYAVVAITGWHLIVIGEITRPVTVGYDNPTLKRSQAVGE